MSFLKPTRNELAAHEAGHAYAFAALTRGDPNELGLGVDHAGQHHGWCNRREILRREMTLTRVAPDALPAIKRCAAAEIVIAIAGTLAEARHRQRNRAGAALFVDMNAEKLLKPGAFDVDGDYQRIRDTLDYIGALDRLATFKRLIQTSETILSANWPSVRRLSDELRRQGVMPGAAVAKWFQRHPAKRMERRDRHLADDTTASWQQDLR